MEKLLNILKTIRSDIDFASEQALIDDGILDSFDLLSIIAELCYEYDINITADDMEPANFNSVNAMHSLIERLLDED